MSFGFGLIVLSRAGIANIIRCLWFFTLLMNLHDFVGELVNPVHSFHDAHTVLFCLTADHISTCLMMFSARFKPAQFWSVLIRGEWKCSTCSLSATLVWSTVTEKLVWTQRVRKLSSLYGVPWISSVWIRGWWSVSIAGKECNGMHRPSVSVTTAGNGTLDQVKYLFLSVDD